MMKNKILLGTMLLFISSFSLKAQIFFLEISPDIETEMSPIVGTMESVFPLDFTFDGMEEYNFKWEDYGSEWFMHFTSSNQNNQIALDGTTVNIYNGRFVKMLSFGDPINSSLTWGNSDPAPYIGESTLNSNFLNQGDQYIGVKFLKNNNTHYGYVLVNFQSISFNGKGVDSRKLIIKAFAFNNSPNAQISAGQTSSSGIETSLEANCKVYPNPTYNNFKIEMESNSLKEISLFNLVGQTVLTTSFNDHIMIDLTNYPSGIYFVKIQHEGGTITRKIIKK